MMNTDERYYKGIVEVKFADTQDAANDLLARGFELLKVEALSFIVGNAIESRLIFVLGRAGTVAKPATPQGPAAGSGTMGPAPTQRPSGPASVQKSPGPANSSRPSNPFSRMAKPMIAKYEGTCRICDGHIQEGDQIVYEQGIGAAHQWCVPAR